jgi:hypothetical protein
LLVLFVLIAIPWTYFNIKFGRQIERRLAALKADGLPVTIADVVPEPVPDAQNAAVVYQTVFEVSFDPTTGPAARTDAPLARLDDVTDRTGGDRMRLAPGARELLSTPEAEQVLRTLRQASELPYSVFPVNWEDGFAALFPHLQRYRSGARVLWAQALISAEDGRTEEALDWCLVALRMSEHPLAEPSLIAQLVGYAVQAITFDAMREILSTGAVSPAMAAEFETLLRDMDLHEGFSAAMDAERALVCDIYDLLRREPARIYSMLDIHRGFPNSIYFGWPGRPFHKLDQLIYLDYAQRYDDFWDEPYRDVAADFDALAQELSRPAEFYRAPTKGVVARTLAPAYGGAARKRDSALAQINLCRVAMALKAHKSTHGAYPAHLEQLQQALDYQLPEDPFSGKDFVYTPQADGFTLYSLGEDLDDDGGATRHDEGHDATNCDVVWECAG